MPPTRSMPPAKAVKTERTHEENQERAYIAASRRSDRSLEARVESARRASEIHKRRTGRSLRVTEQDVQNEEMYEEEDDDLPLQYRRLTAHLQTGSADFNRRLSAYLTNHVAMRSALEQSIHNSYAQQFPNAPQYQQSTMFPSPMLAHQQQQQQQMGGGMMQSPGQGQYRQHPYQSPHQQQQGFSMPHQRNNSIAVPQQTQQSSTPASPAIPTDHKRSLSMSGPSSDSQPIDARSSQTPMQGQQHKPSFPPGSFHQPQQQMQQQMFSLPTYDMGAFGNSAFPSFSTQLPGETQSFLGNTLDQSDPLTSMMMAGSNANMFWNFNGQGLNVGQNYNMGMNNAASEKVQQQQQTSGPQHAPSFAGLNSTLAPASLAIEEPSLPKTGDNIKPEQKNDDSVSPGELDLADDEVKFGDDGMGSSNQDLFFENAMAGKDGVTPGLNGDSWDSWIHDGSWGDVPTASQQST